jgi:hypothetical protein
MTTDLDKYLEKVKRRERESLKTLTAWGVEHPAKPYRKTLSLPIIESQADVDTLRRIVECQRKIIDAKNKVLTAYRLGGHRTPERADDVIHVQSMKQDRILHDAMEAADGGDA